MRVCLLADATRFCAVLPSPSWWPACQILCCAVLCCHRHPGGPHAVLCCAATAILVARMLCCAVLCCHHHPGGPHAIAICVHSSISRIQAART